ncbi:exodeoxyribonuclease V subunit beta [Colwellia sp. E2M01]|uniref:exodeoxyribonuclease V subunit beta n=1 Tax=Colwellia sp. E2M01 TaxID=2841561 RepID=UPI001C084D4F|nr:exodeoxyribonuclease V subunit beta [Colwellia sp. E2M01]MBU2870512.1 exodeoxyribonuclease V subunit beta [Colwellia sp. E2M01]
MTEAFTTPDNEITLKNLDATTIPLQGKHLIEASAGTGKTYNITRIYLRLLLERELTVEQILLMTFTKDATQELRGRIDAFIRLALNNWDSLCAEDPYFATINERVEKTQREFLLKRALLFLDEAAIFTIHGFCQRVLNQYAFTSGLPFNANMAANSSEITLQVCQDWYRSLAKADQNSFMLIAQFWSTPNSFLSSFGKAISHTSELSVIDAANVEAEFIHLVRQASLALTNNSTLIENALILVKKGADQELRRSELAQLTAWLDRIVNEEVSLLEVGKNNEKMPDSFIDGRRYGRSKFKVELVEALSPVIAVKEQVKTIADKINKAKAYAIVKSGIYAIRQKVIEQKQALNILDFDDLINTLADCLNASKDNSGLIEDVSFAKDIAFTSDNATLLAKQLLLQYPVALIDEFQDTDPKQFGILQNIYYGKSAEQANAGLFLIGDPKQAIYGFRGGDIFAYLNARSGCDYHWLMDTNWRSTPEMIAGYNQLFSYKGADETISVSATNRKNSESVFGFGIPYSPVLSGKGLAGEESANTELVDESSNTVDVSDDNNKALQFIHFSNEDESQTGKVKQNSRPVLAQWCANEITSLLSVNQQTGQALAKPKDIAILVRDGAEARDIKDALQQAGLDSVFLSDRANLFHSVQAKQLLCLLKGILLPENERVFVAALSCGLLGYDANKLYQLQQDEIAYQSVKFTFVDYRKQWQRQGFITMAINLLHNLVKVPESNLQTSRQGSKDRSLTNILHLFEILQAASVRLSQGQELLHWFEQQCHLETNEVEAELRLESDGDLIRLITQHGSKGLEYPYVFIPFACRQKDPLKFGGKSVNYLEYHDKNGNLCLSLDGSTQAKEAMRDEAYAESIRLLYVAVTRAEQRCYILCCGFENYHLSPLGQTLQLQEEDNLTIALQTLKASAEHAIGIREVSLDKDNLADEILAHSGIELADAAITVPTVSQFNGNIERDWWLSSFTALSRNIRHAGVSNPDRDSDSVKLTSTESNPIDDASADNICFKLAKGAHTGNLLHDILEHTDFCQPDWQVAFEQPLVKYGALISSSSDSKAKVFTADDLAHWLTQVINTPLTISHVDKDNNELNDTPAILAKLPLNKTLRESEFYFPMEGGQGTSALAKLLTDHRNNNLRGSVNSQQKYPVSLPSYKKLSGMMHGFIDLIFEYQGKYYLCDYKSNHLGDNFSDYQFGALLDNVEKNYYDLQYLIYALALHRYLQQNLQGYDVNKNFGGVYYLYLRGMKNTSQHQGCGVYYRDISEKEINQLDDIFSAKYSVSPEIKAEEA